jgi:two-component system KDP operon response regulator KdpE
MRTLVIDDEPQIRRVLRVGLERNGYSVLLAASGEEGLDMAALHPPDIVILDLTIPGTDGFEVCRRLREWSKVPVIVLSVREGDQEKVRALDLGADDFLTKPFSLDELLARIRAVHRRAVGEEDLDLPPFSAGNLQIDFAHRLVTLSGQELHLTPIEYDLLRTMVRRPNCVLTHRPLLTKVWGVEYADDSHTLRVHITNLRSKIEPDPGRPQFIHTEPRIGYRFRVESEDA